MGVICPRLFCRLSGVGVRRCVGVSAVKLTSSLIYEATLDDQLFAELPVMVAAAFEARSCVFHWRDLSGTAEISTHSGYFSDDQMADYATNFAEHDL